MNPKSHTRWTEIGALTTAGTVAATIFCCLPFATGIIGAGAAAIGASCETHTEDRGAVSARRQRSRADRPHRWTSLDQRDRPTRRGAILANLQGVDELKALFNRDVGKVRLVLLLSPT